MKMLFGCLLALITAPIAAQIPNLADGSGTIAVGGVSQTVFPQNVNRAYLECQNPIAATEPLLINIGSTASIAGGSFEIAPGGSVRFSIGNTPVPTAIVTVTAATTGHRFICKQG